MATELFNALQELVINICDNLYANRQLITKNVVKKLVLQHSDWINEDLDTQLPAYINSWRINNLRDSLPSGEFDAPIEALQADLAKAKAELFRAQQTIQALQALHTNIARELRGILYD